MIADLSGCEHKSAESERPALMYATRFATQLAGNQPASDLRGCEGVQELLRHAVGRGDVACPLGQKSFSTLGTP